MKYLCAGRRTDRTRNNKTLRRWIAPTRVLFICPLPPFCERRFLTVFPGFRGRYGRCAYYFSVLFFSPSNRHSPGRLLDESLDVLQQVRVNSRVFIICTHTRVDEHRTPETIRNIAHDLSPVPGWRSGVRDNFPSRKAVRRRAIFSRAQQ